MKVIAETKALKEIIQIMRLLFPKSKYELILLLLLIILYAAFGLPIALETNFLDYAGVHNGKHVADINFSFDNLRFFHVGDAGGGLHPLIRLFTYPLIYIGNFFAFIFSTHKAKTVIILFSTIYFVSMSSINMSRYLENILNIKRTVSLVLVIMYSLFANSIVLSYTFDSYVFSLFFLSLMIYYYSEIIKKDKSSSLVSDLIFTIGAGGITISNFAKGAVSILFTGGDMKEKIKKILICSFAFLLIVILSYLIIHGNILFNFNLMIESYSLYSENSIPMGMMGTAYKTIESFFIEPILWPALCIREYYAPLDIMSIRYNISEYYGFYRLAIYWKVYLFAAIFYGMIFFSVVLNRRNKLLLYLISFWGIDIVIHLILRYGLFDGFSMYSGHWIFILPILLGFLYKAVTQKYKNIVFSVFLILLLIVGVYNISRLDSFVKLIHHYFGI